MARLPDEQWAMIEDSIEKKRTAASAFKQRTHCGKGGSVKFPSDFMSKKELKAMNGEVKSYRLNDPMSWDEFKELPSDLKAGYIQKLREKFNVPDNFIAEMFDVSLAKLTLYLMDLKLELVHDIELWNKEAFLAWRSGASSELVKENEPVVDTETKYERKPIDWAAFKTLSDPEKVAYIKWIRETFKAPNNAIAESLGCHHTTLRVVLSELNLQLGRGSALGKGEWPKDEFFAWARGEKTIEEVAEEIVEMITEEPVVEIVEEPVVEIVEEPAPIVESTYHERIDIRPKPTTAVPTCGNLTFACPADQALNTLAQLLGSTNVRLRVQWDIIEE